MFCEKCGNQLLDKATFCNICGTPIFGTNAIPKRLTRREWLSQGGKAEVSKERLLVKILTYAIAAILLGLFIYLIIAVIKFISIIEGQAAAMGTPISGLRENYAINVALNGVWLVLALLFGLLGAAKHRTGFSIAYLIFGELSFLLSIALLYGGGLQNILYMIIAAIPFNLIIVMQVRINKAYKRAMNNPAAQ